MTNKEARKVLQEVWRNERTDYESVEVKEAIDRAIKALQERPEGEWIRNEEIDKRTGELHPITFGGIVIYTCSICGSSKWGGNFCPNCGARMGVKKNEQI